MVLHLSPWILAIRPKTLTAAIVPVVVGSGVGALHPAGWTLWVSLCTLAAAILIQVATNLFNDAIDFTKGADTHARLGPRRVTQSGLLSPRMVMTGAVIAALAALVLGIPLVVRGGWTIVGIGLVSLVLSYTYTGGPFPLAYRGFGDLFVFLFFGLIAVGGVVYLHTGEWTPAAFVAGAQVGLLGTVLIAVNNLRDHQQDRAVQKLTLAARFGPRFARAEITGLLLLAYGLGIWWWLSGYPGAAFLPLLSMPLALRVVLGVIRHEPSAVFNRFLAQAAGTQLLFGSFLTLGLVL
jgi:1,4-dihydroxy-2-naphthoate polyprenyltransferase